MQTHAWTSAEDGRLRQLVAAGSPLSYIQQTLLAEYGVQRTIAALEKRRYKLCGPVAFVDPTRASAEAVADMWRRRGLEPQSLTALICGDPDFERSALAKMKAVGK